MKEIPVRRLNIEGCKKAKSFITDKSEPRLAYNFIVDPSYYEDINSYNKKIDLDFNFSNKLELAKYLHKQLGEIPEEMKEDTGFWTYLCFAYLDKFVRIKNGKPKYSASPNYILTHKGHRSSLAYRHRVFQWYKLYDLHGDRAEFFLSTDEPYAQGDTIEQLASRFWVMNKHLPLIHDLFFDKKNGRAASGILVKLPEPREKKNKHGTYSAKGKIRRLLKALQQVDAVYITQNMELSELKKAIGSEFNKRGN